MKFRCLLGHDWVEGRIADVRVRKAQAAGKLARNRICFRCGEADLRADAAENEHEERVKLREKLDGH